MDRSKQFTITPRDLKMPSDELAGAVKRAGEAVPGLIVEKENYRSGVITVSLPEEQAQKTAELLGESFILSPNSKLKLIE
jgi:hypothetical protein